MLVDKRLWLENYIQMSRCPITASGLNVMMSHPTKRLRRALLSLTSSSLNSASNFPHFKVRHEYQLQQIAIRVLRYEPWAYHTLPRHFISLLLEHLHGLVLHEIGPTSISIHSLVNGPCRPLPVRFREIKRQIKSLLNQDQVEVKLYSPQ